MPTTIKVAVKKDSRVRQLVEKESLLSRVVCFPDALVRAEAKLKAKVYAHQLGANRATASPRPRSYSDQDGVDDDENDAAAAGVILKEDVLCCGGLVPRAQRIVHRVGGAPKRPCRAVPRRAHELECNDVSCKPRAARVANVFEDVQ